MTYTLLYRSAVKISSVLCLTLSTKHTGIYVVDSVSFNEALNAVSEAQKLIMAYIFERILWVLKAG